MARIGIGKRTKRGGFRISAGKNSVRVSQSVRIAKGVSLGYSTKLGGSSPKKRKTSSTRTTSTTQASKPAPKLSWNDKILRELQWIRSLYDQGFLITDEENELIKSIIKQDAIEGTLIKQNRRNEAAFQFVNRIHLRQQAELDAKKRWNSSNWQYVNEKI